VKRFFSYCPKDSRYAPCDDEAKNLVHRGNHTAIPLASQEVKHDGQNETTRTTNTKATGEDSTQSRKNAE
jgi:hypothetical protein